METTILGNGGREAVRATGTPRRWRAQRLELFGTRTEVCNGQCGARGGVCLSKGEESGSGASSKSVLTTLPVPDSGGPAEGAGPAAAQP